MASRNTDGRTNPKAPFTQALDGFPAVEYESLCANCFFKHKQQFEAHKDLAGG
jgi:hypothetical protein